MNNRNQLITLTSLAVFQFFWITAALWSINAGSFIGFALTIPLWLYVSFRGVFILTKEG